ncbi:hypothetical protein GCM10023189_01180 [Nibrella saemangeumensis]|uniref:Uncharacterized protein n=1 Tax=Nibrella saemangeumensis TaxID=1084526 RepID=A0ABP8MBT1_9BACT
MFRYVLIFLVLVHGLIHLMGFAKAFSYGNFPQLTSSIAKPAGLVWLLTALLFLGMAVLLSLKKDWWWIVSLAAVVVSQVLIVTVWQDAKVGTFANLIILVAAILGYGDWNFENRYEKDVNASLQRINPSDAELLTEADIQHLPPLVQQYLRYVGALNKPKVKDYHIGFEGQMREKGKDWFTFTSEQYNFADVPTRLFFMKGKMFGVTVPGYHAYKNGKATMQIKLFGLVPIVDIKGNEINKAETVTIFNDMCLMAPATLIDKRITWEPVDDSSVKATFTNNGITISAILYFNEKGQLTNFVSDDRYAVGDMKRYRFSTPVNNYRNFNGYNLPSHGEAVWHYPDGEFSYGKFNLKQVEYNRTL